MTDHEFRIAVALRVTNFLRQAIEQNGDMYHGGLVPNLTSLQDVLTLPIEMIREQAAQTPELNPDVPIDCGPDGILRARKAVA